MQHVLVPSDMDSSLSVTRMMQNRTTLEKLFDEKSVLSVLSALVLVAARIKTLCGSVISGHDRRHSRVPQHVWLDPFTFAGPKNFTKVHE